VDAPKFCGYLADLAGDRHACAALRRDSDPGPSPTPGRRASCRREPQKRPGREGFPEGYERLPGATDRGKCAL